MYSQDEHNRTEVEITGDDYVTATEDMDGDVSESDNESDQTKEQMVMETIQLNRELNKLNKELAMKEHLAAKLIESVSHIGEYCPEENTEELKNKLELLKQERDQLEEALKAAQSNNINSKCVEISFTVAISNNVHITIFCIICIDYQNKDVKNCKSWNKKLLILLKSV